MGIEIINKHKDKRAEPQTYIGRGSVFGNPWPIDANDCRDKVCDQYEVYFHEEMVKPGSHLKQGVDGLVARARKGEDLRLACFCKPHRCHGDTIKAYIEEQLEKEPVNTKSEYRLVIAGSRDFHDYEMLERHVKAFVQEHVTDPENTEVIIISGRARGADKLGERLAIDYGLKIEEYPADWDRYGKSAGYRRNEQMAAVADGAILFWDGESRGTRHMLDICEKRNVTGLLVEYQ